MLTLDQMHTQRRLTRQIRKPAPVSSSPSAVTSRTARRRRRPALDAVAGEASTVDRGHSRTDVRTIKTLPPNDLIRALFPHVEQVFLVERYSYAPDGRLLSAVAVLAVTSLTAGEAGPDDLLAFLRGHSAIEMHHYVRDVVFGEDASRTRRAHRAMAAVRNAVIGALRLREVPGIAAQLRACHRDPYQLPMLLLGLITPLAPNSDPAVT